MKISKKATTIAVINQKIESFTVLCILFTVAGGKAAQRDRDQVAAPLQIFQQQRRAQLLRCADGLTVEALW